MATASTDEQQEIASAAHPADAFSDLSTSRRRTVFFQLPESLQTAVVDDMDREDLRQFVRRLDPDEATDVLGLADESTREAILERLDQSGARR